MSVAPLFPQKPEKIVVPTGVSWKHNKDKLSILVYKLTLHDVKHLKHFHTLYHWHQTASILHCCVLEISTVCMWQRRGRDAFKKSLHTRPAVRDLDTPLSLQDKQKITCSFMFIVLKWGLRRNISLQLFVRFHLLWNKKKKKKTGSVVYPTFCLSDSPCLSLSVSTGNVCNSALPNHIEMFTYKRDIWWWKITYGMLRVLVTLNTKRKCGYLSLHFGLWFQWNKIIIKPETDWTQILIVIK